MLTPTPPRLRGYPFAVTAADAAAALFVRWWGYPRLVVALSSRTPLLLLRAATATTGRASP